MDGNFYLFIYLSFFCFIGSFAYLIPVLRFTNEIKEKINKWMNQLHDDLMLHNLLFIFNDLKYAYHGYIDFQKQLINIYDF